MLGPESVVIYLLFLLSIFSFTAKRKFNRESLIKMTKQQKDLVLEDRPLDSQPLDLDSSTCFACMKKFKNQRGLSIHSKSCKGERAEEAKIKGLEPMFLKWEVRDGKKMSVKEKKGWRDAIRLWLLKRIKLELNLGLSAENPQNVSLEDDSHIHETLVLAGKTIIPCLQGDHSTCASRSSGCGGGHAVTDFSILPTKASLTCVPVQTISWLCGVVDSVLSYDSLRSLVVNGQKASTSLVESIHREIRLPIAKGRMHRKNETALIKSGISCTARLKI